MLKHQKLEVRIWSKNILGNVVPTFMSGEERLIYTHFPSAAGLKYKTQEVSRPFLQL